MIWGVLFVERILKVDDPVGAVAVHGVNGAFGCLAIGLFADGNATPWNGVATAPIGFFYGGGLNQFYAELIGVVANVLWVFPVAMLSFWVIGLLVGGNRTCVSAGSGCVDEVAGPLRGPHIVAVAGEEHMATHGPGVPKEVKQSAPQVPVGRR